VVLVARMLGAAEPRPPPGPTATSDVLGPPPRPPARPSAFGNLVSNWSFEHDLSGWGVIGPATASQEPRGRTSGSSAAVRATGDQPAQVGLVLPKAVPAARRGSRYVASVWVQSSSPGLRVTVRLVASGGGISQASQATGTTLPGNSWRRITVGHTVAAAQAAVELRVAAAAVPPGEALILDEVELRKA
jgi:Carbohydrate binding domain